MGDWTLLDNPHIVFNRGMGGPQPRHRARNYPCCELCSTDLETPADPSGIGNFHERYGYICEECTIELEEENDA